MTDDRISDVLRVCQEALAREGAARVAYLDAACGTDTDLRRDVEALLAEPSASGPGFLDAPPWAPNAPALAVGQRLGAYEVTARLGAGGMGEVYKARDTRLGRTVAIKVLPAGMAADPERHRRFEQEARAVSALNHPHICILHDIGTASSPQAAGGATIDYLVMEYVEGQTLTQRLTKGPLPLEQALGVATEIAEALAAAHRQGVIHRDLKPGNVMLTKTGAKLLDFGLAKLKGHGEEPAAGHLASTGTASTSLTGEGMIVGTLAYMAPEQVEGKPADARTDLWALGVILYEMLTGKRAFDGTSAASLIGNIMNAEPAPLTAVQPLTPRAFDRVVRRCLAKDPDDRWQSANDLADELRWISQTGAVPAIAAPSARRGRWRAAGLAATLVLVAGLAAVWLRPWAARQDRLDSLAVLPFANVGGSPDTEYLSDGITDSLIGSLSEVPGLKVISSTSAFHYKNRTVDPPEVGRTLGVRAIVTGRVTQRGDRIAVSAELVDTRDSRHLWGQQYSRRLVEILAVQDAIAREISAALRLALTDATEKRLKRRYTENTAAYDAYLRGRYYSLRFTEEGLNQGIAFFNQAIALDPNYALAYAGLSLAYWAVNDIQLSPSQAMPRAKTAALKSLELDDSLAEAHTSLAIVKTAYDFDWAGAEQEYRRALELNPGYAAAHQLYGWHLGLVGRFDEAKEELTRALDLDPLAVDINAILGVSYLRARRYDQAVTQLKRTLQLDERFWLAHVYLGWTYLAQRRYDDAIGELTKARELDDNHFALGSLGRAYALAGRRRDALAVIDELRGSKKRYVSPHTLATIYEGLGAKAQAFACLEQSFAERNEVMGWLKVDQRFDSLRSDPRFDTLLVRLGLPQ